MIESLKIENFRCFEQVELNDLKRINVVVGENASGKTALLEALFLAGGGHPELMLRMRGWRGLGDLEIKPDRDSFQSLWRDLFYSFDESRTISISFVGSKDNTRTLRVFFKPEGAGVFIPIGQPTSTTTSIPPLAFETTDGTGHKTLARARISEKGMVLDANPNTMNVTFLASRAVPNSNEAAVRFSNLSKQNQEKHVIDAFKSIFPFIENLSIEVSAGTATLYAYIPWMPEKVPLPLISEGVYQLLSILLAIANGGSGVIMIDEIENGFYHEKIPEIWSLLLRFSELFQTQLFVSTHSLEAIKHILPAIQGNEEKFSLLRTERENDKFIVRQFEGINFRRAIEQRIEMR